MSCIELLSSYLCHRFPWWKGSRMRYEPAQKTVYVYCCHPQGPEHLLSAAEGIARLDIGVERFIITMPMVMDMVIECQPNPYKESP